MEYIQVQINCYEKNHNRDRYITLRYYTIYTLSMPVPENAFHTWLLSFVTTSHDLKIFRHSIIIHQRNLPTSDGQQ